MKGLNIFILGMLFFAYTTSHYATNVNGRIVALNTNNSKLTVLLQVNTNTGTDDMGGATIVLGFDNNVINFNSNPQRFVDYTYQNFCGGTYSTATVTKPAVDKLWLNIDLPFNNCNNGIIVSGDSGWTNIVTLVFDIINPNSTLTLNWLVTNTYWGIYDANNATLWVPDSFTNLSTGILPVELTSFIAKTLGKNVVLKWQTATEINNYGFEIERKFDKKKSEKWEKIGFVNGNGNSYSPKDYSFIDDKLYSEGALKYRLKQIDNDGNYEYSEVLTVSINTEVFELYQNYPNPFNPSTVISWHSPVDGDVTIKIYDILGNEAATLINEYREAGSNAVEFNAINLASGIYIYQIEIRNKDLTQTLNRKMTLLK